jgi:hypothetical protein
MSDIKRFAKIVISESTDDVSRRNAEATLYGLDQRVKPEKYNGPLETVIQDIAGKYDIRLPRQRRR